MKHYIEVLSEYDAGEIAKMCMSEEHQLFDEAVLLLEKAGDNASAAAAMNVRVW